MKKIIVLLLISLAAYMFPSLASAQSFSAEVKVFTRDECTHCQKEKAFLNQLKQTDPNLKITEYNLADEQNLALWQKFAQDNKTGLVTPITVIGRNYLVGFDDESSTGVLITNLIKQAQDAKTSTSLDLSGQTSAQNSQNVCTDECVINREQTSYLVKIPLINKTIDVGEYPLLILTGILGFVDGFNPCAMWVLVSFLVILIQVGSRKKMMLFAGIFILAEAIMYYLILMVWFNTWNFIALDQYITPIVGTLSIIGGILFIKESRKKSAECEVLDLEGRQKTRNRLKELAQSKFTWLTLVGILGLAFSVNVIEFACSLGIPQAFTKILEINQIGWLLTQAYMAVYIFFYMVDDFIVFAVALYWADRLALTSRYSKLTNLFGGILIIILGLILIFQPQALKF